MSGTDFHISRTVLFAACTWIGLGFALSSAEAQTASRAWVSGKGNDVAGCGAVTAPCRTPQYAFTNIVAAGGEIDILDPAGYACTARCPVPFVRMGSDRDA
jgi:hypothetical protein